LIKSSRPDVSVGFRLEVLAEPSLECDQENR
jgi:hypothetical protein